MVVLFVLSQPALCKVGSVKAGWDLWGSFQYPQGPALCLDHGRRSPRICEMNEGGSERGRSTVSILKKLPLSGETDLWTVEVAQSLLLGGVHQETEC